MSTQLGFVLIAAIDAAEVELARAGGSTGTSGCALKYREQERRLTPCFLSLLKKLKKLGSAVWGGMVQYIARVDAFRAKYQVPDGGKRFDKILYWCTQGTAT